MLFGTMTLIVSVAVIDMAVTIVINCGVNIGVLAFMVPMIIAGAWLFRFSIRKLDRASSEETQNVCAESVWKMAFVNIAMIASICAITFSISVFCVIAEQINVREANWHSEAVLLISIFAAVVTPLCYLFRKMRNMRKALKSQRREDKANFCSHTEKIDPITFEPYEYEKYVAKTLLERGYKSASVTKQSGDYGVDVLAVNSEGWRIAIQCKRYQGSVGVSAIQEIITGKDYYGCDLSAVYTTGSYTRKAIELAQKVHAKLYILNKDGLRTVV